MEERKGFGSNFGFLMAAIGSAVGLGNIWGFPNKMGANGGFPFLILYLALALCCGVIIMLGELALGRKTGHGAVGAYQSISKRFKWLGWLGIAAAALIFSFYSALGGYCLRYVVVNFGNLIGAEFGTNGVGGADVFQGLLSQPDVSIAFALAFMLITMLVVMSGVGGGIERVCSVGMPALFFILIICIIRSCTLPGAVDGLKYMFVPGWAVANGIIDEAPGFWRVLTAAGGQMFFSLSLGAGVMITYGSYLDKKQDLGKSTMIIVGMDTVVALMAGLCVIPGRFALDPSGALGGPELLFITMQNVFDKMGPAGPVFGILFYLLVFFAAISSSISMLEVIVAHFCDKAREAVFRHCGGDLCGPVRSGLRRRYGQQSHLPGGAAGSGRRQAARLEHQLAGSVRQRGRGPADALGGAAHVPDDQLGAEAGCPAAGDPPQRREPPLGL